MSHNVRYAVRQLRKSPAFTLIAVVGLGASGSPIRAFSKCSSGNRCSAITLDRNALAFSVLVSIATGLAIGVLPGLQAARVNVNETLKEASRGSPIRAGRDFDERDNARVPHVVIVNETFARRHFPGEDPIGRSLGASPRAVMRMVLGQGRRVTLLGIGLGVVGAFLVSRLMRQMLYEVNPGDPLIYLAVAATLLLIAELAAWVPARRATRIDPVLALRAE